MGMFDSVHTGTRCGQTKAFACSLDDLCPGDEVDGPDGVYAMYEGGWLVVENACLSGWVDEPVEGMRRYDSGGSRLECDAPEGYLYTPPSREYVAKSITRHSTHSGEVLEELIDAAYARRVAAFTGMPDDCKVCARLRGAAE